MIKLTVRFSHLKVDLWVHDAAAQKHFKHVKKEAEPSQTSSQYDNKLPPGWELHNKQLYVKKKYLLWHKNPQKYRFYISRNIHTH